MKALYANSTGNDETHTREKTILARKYWLGNQNLPTPLHHTRYMRPTCLKIPEGKLNVYQVMSTLLTTQSTRKALPTSGVIWPSLCPFFTGKPTFPAFNSTSL